MKGAFAIDAGAQPDVPGLGLQLWLFDLDGIELPLQELPEATRERAARFVRSADGRRYLASHAALRGVLGSGARWIAGAHGKPALADGAMHFSLSRRDGWAAVGMSSTHEIGVDVETLRPIDDAAELAQLHFTPREREGVAGAEDFLRVWTRKEACMKATGLGLSLAPSSFECGARASALQLRIDTPQRAWSLQVHTPAVDAPLVLSWAVVLE